MIAVGDRRRPRRGRAACSLRHRASSQTSVFGTSLIGANPPALSPYSVEKPVASSLLLPVVSTRWPHSLDSAISVDAAHPGLQVLLGQAVQARRGGVGERLLEGLDHRTRSAITDQCSRCRRGEVLGVG